MIQKSNWGLAAALTASAFTLSACLPAQDDDNMLPANVQSGDPFAPYDALASENYIIARAQEADLSGLQAVLPDYVSLDWGSKTLDPDTGAAVFTDLKIGLEFGAEFGIAFKEARIWDLDTSLLAAKLQGARLAEAGPLFSRLESDAVAYYGMDVAFNTLFDNIFGALEHDLPNGPENIAPRFERFDYTIDRLVLTDLSLRPWEMTPWPVEDFDSVPQDERDTLIQAVHLGQQLLALSRSAAYDAFYAENATGQMSYSHMGAQTQTSFSVDKVALSGASGLDFETYLIKSADMEQTLTSQTETLDDDLHALIAPPDGFSITQSYFQGFGQAETFRLDKLAGFLARGELPSMAERDLLSLGRYELSDYRIQLNATEVFTVSELTVDASRWDWLIPSALSIEVDEAVLGTQALAELGLYMFDNILASAAEEAEEADEEAALLREGISRAIEQLADHELDTLPIDGTFSATWDSESGPTDIDLYTISEGYGDQTFRVKLNIPTYEAIQAAYESDDREDAFEDAFQSAFAFRGLYASETDLGGYDKLYAYAHELGKLFPDEGWGATLAGMSPEDMRQYVGTIIRLGNASVAAEFPPAVDWLESLAAYLETGGKIEFDMAPPEPLNEALFEAYEDEPSPEEMVKVLGITVTHKK